MAQAACGAPDEVAELEINRTECVAPSVEAAGAVDAQNASTASLENAEDAFPTAPTRLFNLLFLLKEDQDSEKGTRRPAVMSAPTNTSR